MTDVVNHPSHYTGHPSGIECIEVVRHMNFNLGNAVKYVWRVDDKGDPIENLRKAVFYIEDEIARRERAKFKEFAESDIRPYLEMIEETIRNTPKTTPDVREDDEDNTVPNRIFKVGDRVTVV